MTARILTQARLKELLHYCPESGLFTWRVRSSRNVKAGDVAGCQGNGYTQISISRKLHYAHRLVFLYIEGEMPKDGVDHINHIKDDNRWCNLRHATTSINHMNMPMGKNNTSGFIGVHWDKATSKWKASIKIDGKAKHLGRYMSLMAAIFARKKAEREFGYHENHGVI